MMAFTTDEVAGVADLFGALPRADLCQGLVELAYRWGEAFDESDAAAAVDDALSAYALVAVGSDPELLAPGPAAFPELPDGAADLPHILDAERRTVDRVRVGESAERRFRGEVALALDDGDDERLRELLDVSYDLETWGPVDVADCRAGIDEHL
jgi:hypothetical protein